MAIFNSYVCLPEGNHLKGVVEIPNLGHGDTLLIIFVGTSAKPCSTVDKALSIAATSSNLVLNR